VRAREKRGQKDVKGLSPDATGLGVALSPTITTLADHVVLLPTVTHKPKMG